MSLMMAMLARSICVFLVVFCSCNLCAEDSSLLVEAESFEKHGGWKLDTQFISEMGSPYLMAHGLGKKVEAATSTVEFPESGKYNIFVRTKDWTARWSAKGHPGRFQLKVGDELVDTVFGNEGTDWLWQHGGSISIDKGIVKIQLEDLSGFNGRCDAIYFTTGTDAPPEDASKLAEWRLRKLGLEADPTRKEGYDLVVVGGGYSGMGAAISAARMGCKVALIQDRGVLGGNGSSEVRVWANGEIRRGKFPRIGEIVYEFADKAKKSPGTYKEFEDKKKEKIVRAEKNIDLFLNHHAFQVATTHNRIESVTTFDTRTSERKEFIAPLFVDCTGHGTIGYLAGAKWEMTPNARMGMSNMWAWAEEGNESLEFPETPWALDLEMEDFPYPRDHHGQWFWESGFDKDPINDAEGIRDWNLRAVFGAFNAMKNRGGKAKHKTAKLTWVAYIGGPRESRRLIGDVLLTSNDVVAKRKFKDGCVPSTWSIDLHYPKEQFAKKFPGNPFISKAVFDQRVDRTFGYPVPYRCFYSANIDNLFMAGRCISVTHEALGTTRVMKTCGMMGEVIGKAASICRQKECLPRDVYEEFWPEMEELLHLPGKASRETVQSDIVVPDTVLKLAHGFYIDQLDGIVVDDVDATKIGGWDSGGDLPGFVGPSYCWSKSEKSKIKFVAKVKEPGTYTVGMSWVSHENRATNVPVTITIGNVTKSIVVNMQEKTDSESPFCLLGEFSLDKDQDCTVALSAEGTDGLVCADAIQLLKVDED